MSDYDINKMDFKQLRNEVQLLRDELAIMKRKYEDILYNLDTDNFSSRYVKEQDDMRTAIEVTAEGIKTMVSKEELESSMEQTAEHIQSIVSKGAKLDEAIEIESLEKLKATGNIEEVYVIREKNDSGKLLSETYYYFNDITKQWEVLSGDSIYTVFEQTPEGFAMKGNVLIDGNAVVTKDLTLSGTVKWDMTNSPVKSQYSANGINNWSETFMTGHMYMRMSFDGGKTWSIPTKIVGEDGRNGDDADVTFSAINTALGNLFKTWSGGTPTSITSAYIYAPSVKGGDFYGSVFYAGNGNGFSQMDEDGFTVYDDDTNAKVRIGYVPSDYNYPYLGLGVGSAYDANAEGVVLKLGSGVWVGEASILQAGGEYPGGEDSATDISSSGYRNATGIFIDFATDKIWKYIKGVPTEL